MFTLIAWLYVVFAWFLFYKFTLFCSLFPCCALERSQYDSSHSRSWGRAVPPWGSSIHQLFWILLYGIFADLPHLLIQAFTPNCVNICVFVFFGLYSSTTIYILHQLVAPLAFVPGNQISAVTLDLPASAEFWGSVWSVNSVLW